MNIHEANEFVSMIHLLYQSKVITKEEFRSILKTLPVYKDIFKKKV
jgi:hypothetical protein